MEDDDARRAAALLQGMDDTLDEDSGAATADPSGYYACLGVAPRATQQDIRRAFLFLSQRYHTDKHASQSEAVQGLMNDLFQQLQDAYTVLSDERQRAAYDAGGDTGVKRLALVPVGLNRREDILNYVLSLNREAQMLRTARLLAATSNSTLTFSTAHLFGFSRLGDTAAAAAAEEGQVVEMGEEASARDGGADEGSAAAQHAPAPPAAAPQQASSTSSSPASAAGAGGLRTQASGATAAAAPHTTPPQGSAAAAPSSSTSTPSAPPPAAPPAAAAAETGGASPQEGGQASPSSAAPFTATAQLTAAEVELNGTRQIVLIPNAQMQQQLRQRMQAAAGASSGGGPTSSGSSSAGAVASGGLGRSMRSGARRFSVQQAIMMAIVPKSTTFRSSFQHLVTPRLALTFRTDASSRPQQRATTSLTALADYQADEVRAYGASLRMAVHGLKWCVTQTRALNPLWTLKTKLTVLTSTALLQKLELSLTRKMSATAELENVVAMSLTEHGFFRSSFNDYTADVQQGVSAYMAFHNLYLTAFTGKKVIFGVNTKDPKNPPACGRLQYSVNCSPLAGQSTFGVEAWYIPSKSQRYGLAFTAVVPYAVSPIAPPLFLVRSTQFAVVNQVSLLYARGRHRISVPVIVFISPKVSHGLMWLSVPLALYRIGSMLYRPYARAKAIEYYTQQRKLHVAETDVAREKARMEQLALESLVLTSRASEERKGGLVVINARYGVIEPQFAEVAAPPVTPAASRPASTAPRPTPPATPPPVSPVRPKPKPSSSSSSSGWWPSQMVARVAERLVQAWLRRRRSGSQAAGTADAFEMRHDPVRGDAIPLVIDVTIAVQNLVRDSALTLPAGTKSTLVGFCDPDPYTPEQKKLKIVYWFRKRKHVAVFDDDEEVELPQRAHLIK